MSNNSGTTIIDTDAMDLIKDEIQTEFDKFNSDSYGEYSEGAKISSSEPMNKMKSTLGPLYTNLKTNYEDILKFLGEYVSTYKGGDYTGGIQAENLNIGLAPEQTVGSDEVYVVPLPDITTGEQPVPIEDPNIFNPDYDKDLDREKPTRDRVLDNPDTTFLEFYQEFVEEDVSMSEVVDLISSYMELSGKQFNKFETEKNGQPVPVFQEFFESAPLYRNDETRNTVITLLDDYIKTYKIQKDAVIGETAMGFIKYCEALGMEETKDGIITAINDYMIYLG